MVSGLRAQPLQMVHAPSAPLHDCFQRVRCSLSDWLSGPAREQRKRSCWLVSLTRLWQCMGLMPSALQVSISLGFAAIHIGLFAATGEHHPYRE